MMNYSLSDTERANEPVCGLVCVIEANWREELNDRGRTKNDALYVQSYPENSSMHWKASALVHW
jgi:hypothetical protein